MIIRKATKKDINEIARLFQEYGELEHGLDKNVKTENLNEIIKTEKKHMTLGTEYLIAEQDNKALGVLNINISLMGKEKIGVLHTLIITKDARGAGMGTRLVKYALNYFKKNGCSRVRTFIHISNKNALGFWKKQGFYTEEGYTASRGLK